MFTGAINIDQKSSKIELNDFIKMRHIRIKSGCELELDRILAEEKPKLKPKSNLSEAP